MHDFSRREPNNFRPPKTVSGDGDFWSLQIPSNGYSVCHGENELAMLLLTQSKCSTFLLSSFLFMNKAVFMFMDQKEFIYFTFKIIHEHLLKNNYSSRVGRYIWKCWGGPCSTRDQTQEYGSE